MGSAATIIANATFHKIDLPRPGGVTELVADANASHLLHLAWSLGADHQRAPKHLDWISASFALLRAFVESGGQRAVFAGTAVEYRLGTNPLDEIATPCWPTKLYEVAKDSTRRAIEGYALAVGSRW